MYVDSELLFSQAQAVTAAAASTNVINLGVASNHLGLGETLYVVVQCDVAMTDGSSDSTLAVALYSDGDETVTSSDTLIMTVGTFAALSAIGTTLIARLPAVPANAFEQYIGLVYTPANGNLTTGSFTAFLAKDIQRFVAFASGFEVS